MSVNKAILVGHLGQNPELRYTQGGHPVVNFSMATNEKWVDKAGQKQEKTEWHRVVVWGKVAEVCNQYLSKGRQVYVEGKLQTRQWDDKDGNKRYTTEVVAQSVQFLGGGGGGQAEAQGGGQQHAPATQGAPAAQQPAGGPVGGFADDSDIPF